MIRHPRLGRLAAALALAAAPAWAQSDVSIGDAVLVEGNGGVTQAVFEVEVTTFSEFGPERALPVTIDYATRDGSATAGEDYGAQSGSLVFPTDGIQTIAVDVLGDLKVEADESFFVDLSTADPSVLFVDGEGEATVQNDDATAISIDDVSVVEGGPGTTAAAAFTLSLSAPSDFPVEVDLTTADATATLADGDYGAVAGRPLFAPGVTSLPVVVTVFGDAVPEPDETFTVDLTNPLNATIAKPQGVGTIANDDVPELSVDDVTVIEGDAGSKTVAVTVRLSAPAVSEVRVDVETADATATLADGDYQAASTTVTFSPGLTVNADATVTVHGDLVVEPDETFTVRLSDPVGASLADPLGVVTIANDDAAELTIGDVSLAEGDAGKSDALFPVSLSKPSASAVTVAFSTRDGSAQAGRADYDRRDGTLSFAPGVTAAVIAVPVVGDTVPEPDEKFQVVLADPVGATLGQGIGVATIVDDDDAEPGTGPGVIRLVAAPPAAEGSGAARVELERAGGDAGAAAVTVAAVAGTATAGEDYRFAPQRVSWSAGESGPRTVTIGLVDDRRVEGDESLTVELRAPSGAPLAPPTALTLTILDDDVPARIEIVGEADRRLRVGAVAELAVRVTTGDGSPVAGAVVGWSLEGPGELAGEAETETGADGTASQRVRLGPAPGRVRVTAALADGQEVAFTLTVEGDLAELFDPLANPGESSVAAVLDEACREPPPGFEEVCAQIFALDPEARRRLISELTPSETGGIADAGLRAPWAQVLNLRQHLAAIRGGGGGGLGDLALSLGGQPVPLGALAAALSGVEPRHPAERLLLASFDAALDGGPAAPPEAAEAAAAAAAEIDEPSRWSFFLSGRVEVGERPATALESGWDVDTLGVTAGADYRLRLDLVVGAALGFTDTRTTLARGGGGLDLSGASVSLFGTWFGGERLWADWIVSWSDVDYDARRVLELPAPLSGGGRVVARAAPGGQQLAVEGGIGWDAAYGATGVSGFARLSYLEARVDGFTETGGGPFNLRVRPQRLESLVVEAGVEVVWALSRRWGVLQPSLRASALHELEDDPRTVVATFAALPGTAPIRVPTGAPDRDFVRAAAGLSATLARGRGLYLLYEADLARDDLDLARLTAGLRLEF